MKAARKNLTGARGKPAAAGASAAKLVVTPSRGQAWDVVLPRTVLSIGRDSSNDLVLRGTLVSRRHAVIEASGDQYFLRDCESRNGLAVNGELIREHLLRDGDLVSIGTTELRFCADGEAPETEAGREQAPEAERKLG